MSDWRLEQAKLGTSNCQECWKPIKKGEWRFGKTVNEVRWYHLRCAERGAPKVFPPFAKQAAKILGDRSEVRRPLSQVDRATIVAAGSDSLPVLADWLQSKGDPWGEYITLRLAGNHEAAREFFNEHLESLLGDLNPKDLEWKNGVIHSVDLQGPGRRFTKGFEAVFSHRTAARLVSLKLGLRLDAEMLRTITAKAPSTLTSLAFSWDAAGLEALALPSLESLKLWVNEARTDGLLKAKLPKLRALRLTSAEPLSPAFVSGLLACPWFGKLERLEFDSIGGRAGTLNDAALRVLMADPTRLSRLKLTWVELAGRSLKPKEAKLADKLFRKSNSLLLETEIEEQEAEAKSFDDFW